MSTLQFRCECDHSLTYKEENSRFVQKFHEKQNGATSYYLYFFVLRISKTRSRLDTIHGSRGAPISRFFDAVARLPLFLITYFYHIGGGLTSGCNFLRRH